MTEPLAFRRSGPRVAGSARATTAVAIALAIGAGAFAGPAAAQIETIGPKPATERAKGPAAKPAKALRIGIVAPARASAALERIEPFRRHMARTFEEGATVAIFPDEAALIEGLIGGRVDYAPLSASGYATATVACGCVEPVGVPRATDRTAGWHAIVVARSDGPLAKLEDLGGRRLAVTAGDAVGLRRLPTRLIAKSFPSGGGPRLVEEEGPREALTALIAGQVDAALVWSSMDGDALEGWSRGTLRDAIAAGEAQARDVRVVWMSPVLPHGPHVARASLDEGRKRRLREMLVGLDDDADAYEAIEPVFAGGFTRIGPPAYAPFLELVRPPAVPGEPGATGSAPPPG